jgi:hypothetical protein
VVTVLWAARCYGKGSVASRSSTASLCSFVQRWFLVLPPISTFMRSNVGNYLRHLLFLYFLFRHVTSQLTEPQRKDCLRDCVQSRRGTLHPKRLGATAFSLVTVVCIVPRLQAERFGLRFPVGATDCSVLHIQADFSEAARLTTHLDMVSKFKISGRTPPLSLYSVIACTGTASPFIFTEIIYG